MVNSYILEGDLLLLLKSEVTGVLGPLENSKFGGYKSYNLLAAPQAKAQLRRVPQAYLSYLRIQFMVMMN